MVDEEVVLIIVLVVVVVELAVWSWASPASAMVSSPSWQWQITQPRSSGLAASAWICMAMYGTEYGGKIIFCDPETLQDKFFICSGDRSRFCGIWGQTLIFGPTKSPTASSTS